MTFRSGISLAVWVCAVLALSESAYSYDWGTNPGDGSPGNPYQISTAEQLASIGSNVDLLNKNYILMNSIDMNPAVTGIPAFTTAIIAPDTEAGTSGFQGTAFTGMFNGQGNIIQNLIIDTGGTAKCYLGLFGKIDTDGEILNLNIENSVINSEDDSDVVGTLVAYSNGIIDNCSVTCAINLGKRVDGIGGIVGTNRYGEINSCTAAIDIDILDYSSQIGGIAGSTENSLIYDCHSSGTIDSGGASGGVGGVLGESRGNKIDRCDSSVIITVGNGSGGIGGLTGRNDEGLFSICYATGSVTGGTPCAGLGGLVGDNSQGSIRLCYSNGDVSGGSNSNRIGGFVGEHSGNITNCYADSIVTGGDSVDRIGGFVGESSGSISNCYFSGSLSVGIDSDLIGGFVGENTRGISSSYFLDTAGPNNGYGTPLTHSEMLDPGNFEYWDFLSESINGTSEIWTTPATPGYPILSIFDGYVPPTLSGSGTELYPYLIGSSVELGAVCYCNPNTYFELINDINLDGITWGTAVIPYFDGGFNGNGHVINHLAIIGSGYLGLFEQIGSDGSVANLRISSLSIVSGDGAYRIGGLAGINKGNINNCHVTGSLLGGDNSSTLGGLAGQNYGEITCCSLSGSITGGANSNILGGLIGYNSSDINFCYSTGTVTGGTSSRNFGGLVGANGGGSERGHISQCYSRSNITVEENSSHIGGLIGYDTSWSLIDYCYSMGLVIAGISSDKVGGLVGCNEDGSIENSFWDIENSGTNVSEGGVGLPTLAMQQPEPFLNAFWDFTGEIINGVEDIWAMPAGDEYPVLRWQLGPTIVANDDFYNAEVIHLGDTVNANTIGATGLDLTAEGYQDSLDVWYFFDAEFTGRCRVSLCGSNFDTTLAVFDGASVEIAFNDDSCGYQSELVFKVKAGKRYYIRVAGYDEETGDFSIHLEREYLIGDFDGDEQVDVDDLEILCVAWLSRDGDSGIWNGDCDIYQDGVIDLKDISIFNKNWLTGVY